MRPGGWFKSASGAGKCFIELSSWLGSAAPPPTHTHKAQLEPLESFAGIQVERRSSGQRAGSVSSLGRQLKIVTL